MRKSLTAIRAWHGTARNQRHRSLIWLSAGMLCFAASAHAQSDIVLAPIGGSGGGQFTGRCPSGQLLNGVELRTGHDVDSIKPICLLADTGQRQPYTARFGGEGGGEPTPYVCPHHDAIVTGIKIAYEGNPLVVKNIHLLCGAASTSQVREFPGDRFDGYSRPRTGIMTPFRTVGSGEQRCPTGLVAVGIHGRSGVWLDAVGLICAAPLVTGTQPGPPKALGRVQSASPSGQPRSLCDSARAARARNSPSAPGLEARCRAAGAAGELDVEQMVFDTAKLPASPAPAATATVKADVDVYDVPGGAGTAVGMLRRSGTVSLLSACKDGWCNVKADVPGGKGWVWGEFLTF